MKKVLACFLVLVMVLSLTACGGSQTQSSQAPVNDKYPSKPITCIVPFTAGGGTDVIARMMSSVFPTYCDGGTLVVENQAGGAAVPGTIAVKDAANDGYTISYSFQANWTMRQHVLESADYTLDDFTLICGIELQHNGIFVRDDSPFKTIQDLIDYAKANPGMKFSTGPAASYQEIVANGFLMATGIDALNVPYDGARQAALGMIAGDIEFTVSQATTYSSELGAGSVRMLLSFEDETYMEGVPTAKELGLENCTFSHRSLIFGPANLPEDIVLKLEAAFKGICEDETFQKLAKNSNADLQFVDHKTLLEETKAQDDTCIMIIKKTMTYVR